MTATPTFHVTLPLEVKFRPARPSTEKDPCWAALIPGSAVPVAWLSRDELVALGVDADRIARWGESDDEYRARRVFETLGLASVCWENPGGAGVFDSTRAADAGRELLADLGIEPPVGYKVVLAPTETGRVEFHETGTVDPPAYVPPGGMVGTWTWKDDDDGLVQGVTDFTVDAATGDEIPETMFAGTEPQDERHERSDAEIEAAIAQLASIEAADIEAARGAAVTAVGWPISRRFWTPNLDLLSRLESDEALSIMVNAIGWVALGGDPGAAEGTLDATPEQLDDLRLAARRARDHLLEYARRPDIPPPAPETPPAPTWKDCNGAALMVGDTVRDVDSGTVGVLEAAEDKYPPMAARFRAPNGGTYLVIPHADLEAAT